MAAIITSPNAPAALGPYSHAVLAGDTLFTSGQIGLIPETGVLAGDTIEAQATQVFANLKAVLAAADMTFRNVVKTTVFLTDLNDFAPMNALYAELFPSNPPARSCVQVAKLPAGAKIERSWQSSERACCIPANDAFGKAGGTSVSFFFPKYGLRNAFISLKTSYTPGCFFYNL